MRQHRIGDGIAELGRDPHQIGRARDPRVQAFC
jgi:hypothetical protein